MREGDDGLSARQESQLATHLLRVAGSASRAGDEALATESLGTAIEILERQAAENPDDRLTQRRLLLANFLDWDLFGTPPDADLIAESREGGSEGNNCEFAAMDARAAILRNDRVDAERHTAYLLDKGYFEPDFVRFCRRYELCPER
jgi:hypothetical protein